MNLTSYFTPWNQLQEKQAGFNVDIQQKDVIAELFNQLAKENNQVWEQYCKNAYNIANEYYAQLNFQKSYTSLFQ